MKKEFIINCRVVRIAQHELIATSGEIPDKGNTSDTPMTDGYNAPSRVNSGLAGVADQK